MKSFVNVTTRQRVGVSNRSNRSNRSVAKDKQRKTTATRTECVENTRLPRGERGRNKKCKSKPNQQQLYCCLDCRCTTKNNKKCKRRVCFGNVCWQHARLLYGIRTSVVKELYYDLNGKRVDLNRGLYAERDLQKGCKIGLFNGEVLNAQEMEKRYPGNTLAHYGIRGYKKNKEIYFDNRETSSNMVRFANDSHGLRQKKDGKLKGVKNNAKMIDNPNGAPILMTTRNIKSGEQIFVSYGNDYWTNK